MLHCKIQDLVRSTVARKMWPCWCALFSLCLSLSVQSGSGLNISTKCDAALGFENFEVYDSQLTTQSDSIRIILDNGRDMDIHAGCGRLNLPYCAICGSSKNGQYFQVDLWQDHTIIGVATQGFQALITYFVRSYNLTHSRDGQTWSIFPEVLTGNHDGTSVVKHIFSSPMCARYIRLYPTGYSHGGFCVRMELYGCSNCSSLLSTTSSTTTQHSENNTTKNNRTTAAASSTEMPLIIHSASASSALSTISSPASQHDQSVGSSKVLRTTQGGEKTLPTESGTLNITTQMDGDNSREGFSKTLMIALVVVASALVIIIICLLVALLCRRQRKGIYHCNPRNGMQSKETVEINDRTERDCIASGSYPEVTVSSV